MGVTLSGGRSVWWRFCQAPQSSNRQVACASPKWPIAPLTKQLSLVFPLSRRLIGPIVEQAELVALGVGKHDPRHLTLTDVGPRRAQS